MPLDGNGEGAAADLSVSVVMPARDTLSWIPKALASVGTEGVAEILVVDDGSTDGTSEFLARQAAADPRMRILQGPRVGPSASRNLAIAEARAPLVAFLDSDDAWTPGKLRAQLALHAREPSLGFSFTDYRHVTDEGEDRGACFPWWPTFAAAVRDRRDAFLLPDAMGHIYAENVVGTSTVVARTDLLREVGGFETGLGSAEDWDLWLRMAARAPVGCVADVLADYLMHRPGNVSGKSSRRSAAMRTIAERHRAAVRATAPWAVRACEVRLLVAEAEACDSAGRELGFRMRAAALSPSRRTFREAAATAARAVRGR